MNSGVICFVRSSPSLFFFHPPKQITYQYLNRKARRSGNIFVIVVFCKSIYFFFPVCLFLTALNSQQNHVIAPSPGLAAEAPHRAARPGWQRPRLQQGRAFTGLARSGTASPTPIAASSESCVHNWDSGRCSIFHTEEPEGGSPTFAAPRCISWSVSFPAWRVGVEGRRTP